LLSASLQALRPSSSRTLVHHSLGWTTAWYGSVSTCTCYLQIVRNNTISLCGSTYASIIRSSNRVHNASWTINVLNDFVWKLQKIRMTRDVVSWKKNLHRDSREYFPYYHQSWLDAQCTKLPV
jgi:hypothetical protein